MSEYSDRVRREWGMLNAIREAEFNQPDDLDVFRNIPYRAEVPFDRKNGWNLLDLYVPKYRNEKIPVIMSFHGGSYVYGSKEMYQYYLMSLAQRGFAVVNFNYRLAPEYKFPTAFEDANCVIDWVREHAAEYNLDLENFFLIGDSAGAHYTAMYTLLCVNHEFSERIGVKTAENFVPKAVGLNCGIYKLNWFFYLLNDFVNAIEDVFGEETLRTKKIRLNGKSFKLNKVVTIGENFTKDFPPAFVMTGAYDFVKFQKRYMERLLRKYKIPHEIKVYGSRNDKDTIHNFHANLDCSLSKVCNDDECNFFKSLIKN